MTASVTSSQAADTFFLRPGTLDDIPELVAMINLCSQEISGKDEFTIEDFRNEWTDPSLNLATDTRVAQTRASRIVGTIETWNSEPYVDCWTWGRVHPEFRNQGIGTALMSWAEANARTVSTRAPADTRTCMSAQSISTHQPTIDLLSERGFRVVRHALTMERELDGETAAPVWPAGITIRTMQPGEELAVYRAKNEAFRDHWGHIEIPEEQDFAIWQHRNFASASHDPSLWFLALDGEQIAGAALCDGQHNGDTNIGWVDSLTVRRPWRRRGLAQALLLHSFGELYRRGRHTVGLGVDAESLTGATRLYERVGLRAIREFITFEKELRAGVNLATQTLESSEF